MKLAKKAIYGGIKTIILSQLNALKEHNRNRLFQIISLILDDFKYLFFKLIKLQTNKRIFLIGEDFANWSINKDRKNAEYFLKLTNTNITKNIFKATTIFCVWYESLLQNSYKWVIKLKKLLNFKIIATITNDIQYHDNFFNELRNIIDVWIAPSSRISKYLISKGLRVYYIPFYISDKEFFHINKKKQEICELLNLNYEELRNKIIIGSFQRDSLGSLNQPKWQKNPDLFVNIVRKLADKRYIVLIAGPRRHYIINQFKKYKIPFLYYGNYNYIRDNEDDNLINNHPANIINMLYNLADIYLVTSKIEGGPKAILETGLTKTLIFSTDVGLSKDFIHQDLIYSEENIYKVLDFLNNFEKNEDKIKNYVEFNFNNIKRVLDEKYYTSLYRNLLKTEL